MTPRRPARSNHRERRCKAWNLDAGPRKLRYQSYSQSGCQLDIKVVRRVLNASGRRLQWRVFLASSSVGGSRVRSKYESSPDASIADTQASRSAPGKRTLTGTHYPGPGPAPLTSPLAETTAIVQAKPAVPGAAPAWAEPFAVHLEPSAWVQRLAAAETADVADDGDVDSDDDDVEPATSAAREPSPGSDADSGTEDPFGLHLGGPALQRRAAASATTDSAERVHAAAAHGIGGAGGPLPFVDTIQRSFGHHDLSSVVAHTDGAAREGALAMGASAFATGHHVAFAASPDLHTVAHEAAHVVQQRAGVQLKGGVGVVGDPYELHSDRVADRVVAGDSAEALLDELGPRRGGGAGGVVMRKPLGLADLSGELSLKAKVNAARGKPSTFAELREYLGRYERAVTAQDELRDLQQIEMLINEWLRAHGGSKKKGAKVKQASLSTLLGKVHAEIANLGAAQQAQYATKLANTNQAIPGLRPGVAGESFTGITESGARGAVTAGAKFAAARDNAAAVGMSDEELAAIRIYSGGDYRYMNAILNQDKGWLDAQSMNLSGFGPKKETRWADPTMRASLTGQKGHLTRHQERVLQIEAMQHARVAMAGLQKVPDEVVDGFRGFTITKAELERQYKAGNTITWNGFSSCSTDEMVSRVYATQPEDGKVGLLLTLKIVHGKNIAEYSQEGAEKEVLVLPGAKFTVVGDPTTTGGTPPLYRVTLQQTEAGSLAGVPPGRRPPSAAQTGVLAPAGGVAPARPTAVTPPMPATATTSSSDDGDDGTPPVVGQPVAAATGPQPTAQPGVPAPQPVAADPSAASPTAQVVDEQALQAAAAALAQELIAVATDDANDVTVALREVAAEFKGKLDGLQYRLKTTQSLTRKLADRARTVLQKDAARSIADVLRAEAAAMNDVLRFTINLPANTYADAYTAISKKMSGFGYSAIPTREWNGWTDYRGIYKGVNLTFKTRKGQLFEVQLHTDDSLLAKEEIHPMYEERRAHDTTPERRAELDRQMKERWGQVPVPRGMVPGQAKK